MNCQELKEFVENNLPVERASTSFAEAQQHASMCPACAAVLAGTLQLEDELKSLSGIEADEHLTQSVMRRIDNLSQNPSVGRAPRELRDTLSMLAGTIILAAVYWWTVEWTDAPVRALSVSLLRNWAVIITRLGQFQIDVLLPTVIGAALIAMGLFSDGGNTWHPMKASVND